MSPLDMLHLIVAGSFLGMALYCYVNSLFIPIKFADTGDMENVEFLKALSFFVLFILTLLWFVFRRWG